jgi:hypothetical protein
MGYAEAIEQQAHLIGYWQTSAGIAHAEQIRVQELTGVGVAPSAHDLAHSMWHELMQAEPYYVGPPICHLFAGAAPTFPEVTMLRESAPASAGFVWFAEALPFDGGDEDVSGLRAFSWELMQTLAPDDLRVNCLSVGFYVDHRRYAQPMLVSAMAWDFGSGWDKPWFVKHADDERVPLMLRSMRRYVAQFFAFVNQRLLTVGEQPIHNRSVRRRLAKAIPHDPVVRVVELRRRDYQQRDESQPRDVEYSCQWLVRGHWHQYHTREGLQPRWVMPYVKGPSDKPLRVAEKIAYEVVR